MRLIYTTHDPDKGRTFANFLSSRGIENQLEMTKGSDWGKDDYGDAAFKVWIYDEDSSDAAEKWAEAFKANPDQPMFRTVGSKTTVIPEILGNDEPISYTRQQRQRGSSQIPFSATKELSVTSGLLLLCVIFYLISVFTAPRFFSHPENVPPAPLLLPTIDKQFYYDYPRSYEIIDKIVKLYGADALESPSSLPPEGRYLYSELEKTPYWGGYYDHLLAYFNGTTPPPVATPPFEKIKEGEVWRLFTPALLHSSFLHILFNMLWLLILGKQLEERLNARSYILLVLIIGIVSNTAQYLMSGPNFMGFSGVVCGMVGFICVRQKIAPWEGYPLERSTSMFLIYFISALFLVQLVSFYFEAHNNFSFSPGIANTAHISGAITGALLAFLPLFKKNQQGGISK